MISFADLHCDTLSECYLKNKSLEDKALHINLSSASQFERYIQVFAHFIPERQADKWAWFNDFLQNSKLLLKRAEIPIFHSAQDLEQKRIAVLSVEGGDLFENLQQGEERIPYLRDEGISFFSLIYNQTNRFGCGAASKADGGLTELGKSTVPLLEENGIIIDVSHASRQSTEDILDIARRPVCATHSNAFALCNHLRNLTDRHLRRIADSGGLVGINLYPPFLSDNAQRSDIYRHISYVLDICGQDALCFGCDFDGVDCLPDGVHNLSTIEVLFYEMKQLGYPETLLEKIFYNNIMAFLNANFRR